MNTLIVPTDFSPAADKAIAYAAQLAMPLEATVLLLHMYQMPVPMTDYPVLMITADDLRKTADAGLQRIADEARKNFAGVAFEIESRLGDVTAEIQTSCEDRKPFAVVVSVKETKEMDRFLFGDTALSLIKHCTYPVIAVPESAAISKPANLMLATDLLNTEEIPTENIKAIATVLNATLHVVHVEATESTTAPAELMNAFAGVNASYHAIKEENVTEGLKQYAVQNNIDLVLMLPHKHNLYERLFFKGHAASILHSMPVPVMSLRNE